MKKLLITCILVVMLLLSLVGCEIATVQTESENKSNSTESISMFVEVESTTYWKVVYHKETRVMYTVNYGNYNCGTFTLLVDADGNPMIWDK